MAVDTLSASNIAPAFRHVSEANPAISSKWKTTKPVRATKESFLDLLEGRTPLLHEAAFLCEEDSTKLANALEPRFTPYLHAIGPQLDKVGIAQFEFQAQSEDDVKNRSGTEKQEYFKAVRKLANSHERLAAEVGFNAFAKVFEFIKSIAPDDWEVMLATETIGDAVTNGTSEPQSYFAGIVRGINNGTPIHCDWVPYDTRTESWSISRVTHQAVFNLSLSPPPPNSGGTTVHDVQWTPKALAFRDPEGYGYFPGLVEGHKRADFQPRIGDLYFFNSRNMHEVHPVVSETGKRRMGMSSFFGVLPPQNEGEKTKLVFWS
ncbi:hypothetical protein DSL72_009059 [Monilinia vaccinii-corymbosi]|uniref:Prolyl 4-hydroxylase alpha subunit Fe(2+) 2OG dioxygenase domain-containing protein n=1 Tax=Monilinia vaccinii-corymbosi TaxID=61207 RepID=A0A8A3PNB5_9HELO|nr:hypothetical protein DSL72_009059 [Monilinia vaccinii-corymbosi]